MEWKGERGRALKPFNYSGGGISAIKQRGREGRERQLSNSNNLWADTEKERERGREGGALVGRGEVPLILAPFRYPLQCMSDVLQHLGVGTTSNS